VSTLVVRPSTVADLAAITAIYSHYVLHTTSTFELNPPTVEEMARRREAVLALGMPYLAAEAEGRVIGYAYAGQYRPRPAYRFTVEDSIYVAHDSTGRGHGHLLLEELISACAATPARQMIAVIADTANLSSIALHARCGFRMVGTLEDVGQKFNRWVDTVLMQRGLGNPAE
jgi:phosphinothricin acetyltransferase